MVQSAHGLFPVPAPATVQLLGDAPVYSGAVQKELVTPTGALIATTYATSFGPLPAMSVERVGYGAGERDDPSTPNVLRVLIGRAAEHDRDRTRHRHRVRDRRHEPADLRRRHGPAVRRRRARSVLRAGADEEEPAGHAADGGRAAGAAARTIADIIFRETTTIGLRHYEVDRECLQREIVTVETPLGAVRFKVARRDGRVVNAVPEFEDCARLAAAHNLPVKEVQAHRRPGLQASRS